jgi:hypothetical protein
MNKIGRNDLCPCGSGKKYKKCCLDVRFPKWRNNAKRILADDVLSDKIQSIFFGMLEYIQDTPDTKGFCYASASVFYVLFRELGLPVEIYIGQVEYDNGALFDHSWVEIDGEIYDAAVVLPLIEEIAKSPVFKGFDLDTCIKQEAIYGYGSVDNLDTVANAILNTPITEYMNEYPKSENGLWDVAAQLAVKAGFNITFSACKRNIVMRSENRSRDKTR